MGTCEYCEQSLDLAPHDSLHHDECAALAERRANVDRCCYKCGENPIEPGDGWVCSDCRDNNKPFQGFPGPGAT